MINNHIFLKITHTVYYAILAVFCVFSMIHLDKYYIMFQHNIGIILSSMVLIGICYVVWLKAFQKIAERRKNLIPLYFVIFGWMICNALLILKVATPAGWDSFELTHGAQFDFDNARYFVTYPNNVFPTLLLSGWWKGLSFLPISPYRIMVLLNLLCVYIALILLVICADKLGGHTMAYKVAFWSLLIIGTNPCLSIVYTDTMVLPFLVGFLYCLLSIRDLKPSDNMPDKKKSCSYMIYMSLYGGIAALCVVLGILIKPTTIIILISTFIITLISLEFFRWKRKEWIVLFIAICIGVLGYAGVQKIEEPITQRLRREAPEVRAKSPLHYICMGLTEPVEATDGYGSYSQEEVTWTNDHIMDDSYALKAMERISGKIKDFGFFGLVRHQWNKLVWMGSDGSFAYGMEGGYHIDPQSSQGTLRGKLQNMFYTETDFYQKYVGNFLQAGWILFLFICLLQYPKRIREEKTNYYICIAELAVIGMVLFLSIFENRSRYLFQYLPFFLLAGVGVGGRDIICLGSTWHR